LPARLDERDPEDTFVAVAAGRSRFRVQIRTLPGAA
jgi:hypothetical protein